MKSPLLAALAAAFPFICANAQVENRALSLTAEGCVECGAIPELNGIDSQTIQLWFNPTKWSGTLLQRGNLAVALSGTKAVNITIGSMTMQAEAKGTGQWQQLTVVNNGGNVSVLVDGKEAAKKTGATALDNDTPLVLGEGYEGLIDEVRIWDTAIDNAYGYFWNNTINEFNDMNTNLVVYYKMDHEEWTTSLVDYKSLWDGLEGNHHGYISGGTFVSADNPKLPYLLNGAYTANERFYDRSIEREAYLMSNDIIILGIKSFSDGHLEYSSPCNHATLQGTARLENEYNGRSGVLALDGAGYLESPEATFTDGTNFTIEGWIYIDEWVEGANLFRKGTVNGKNGFSISLGGAEDKQLLVNVAGGQYIFNCAKVRDGRKTVDALPFGEWVFVGLGVRAGGTATTAFYMSCGGLSVTADASSTGDGTYTPAGIDGEKAFWGEGFKGRMDQLAVHHLAYSADQIKTHGEGLMTNLFPGIKKKVTSKNLQLANTLYLFDDAEQPGWDSYSQDEWLRMMRSAFDGYRGYKMRISVKSHDGWETTISYAARRQRFASDLALLAAPYDGVELDLEWNYNTSWESYGELIDAIRSALPSEKTFMVSCHNVTYKFVPKNRFSKCDGFTFQQYGPQKTHFLWSTFETKAKEFVNYGYPKNKVYLSYSTTTSNSSTGAAITGIRSGALEQDGYVPSNDCDEYPTGNGTYYFVSPIQVYRRAQYVTDNNLQGIFYWDMGNDMMDYHHPYHYAKMSTYGLNANVDRIVTDATPHHPMADGISRANAKTDNAIYDLQGRCVAKAKAGLYIVNGKKTIIK